MAIITDGHDRVLLECNRIFEDRVRPHVDVDAEAHTFVAIDLHTGDYAVEDDERDATQQLLERHPDARGRIWYRRVGDERVHRMGPLSRHDEPEGP
jgi:hypothetical protein